jgi:Flp pilus assembly protein TadB
MHNFGDRGRLEANWLTLVFAALCTVAIVGTIDPVVEEATTWAFFVLIGTGLIIMVVRRIVEAVAMHRALYDPLEVLLREEEEAKKNEQP